MAAQVALRRQQNANSPSSNSQLNSMEYIEKIQNMENLLAQKRAYHKQLKSLQQSTYNKQFNKGEILVQLKCMFSLVNESEKVVKCFVNDLERSSLKQQTKIQKFHLDGFPPKKITFPPFGRNIFHF